MKKLILIYTLLISTLTFAQKNRTKSDTQLIAQLRTDWILSLQNKHLQKAMSVYTDDAIFYSPGMKAVNGKKAISDLYQMVMKQFTSHCNLNSSGVEICGPMAYDSGSYSETLLDAKTHKTNSLKGNYLMTLKKQADGNWKISRIMWTEYK
jgi:uncharacterized protein (TIGR02246 family)